MVAGDVIPVARLETVEKVSNEVGNLSDRVLTEAGSGMAALGHAACTPQWRQGHCSRASNPAPRHADLLPQARRR